jgi:hypothetical protein
MIISHTGKFIFIHVPRTGGTSMTYSLSEEVGGSKNINVEKFGFNSWRPMFHDDNSVHRTYIEKQEVIDKYRDYFSFAFIRNPWDRILSYFTGHRKSPKRVRDWDINIEGFTDYLIRDLHNLPPCAHWVCDTSGKIALNYVARFENWKQEHEHISKELGLSLPYHNIGKSGDFVLDYHDFYTDKTRQLVYEAHKEDIKLFGYTY